MYSLLLVDDESIILEGIYEVIKEAGMPLKEIQTASSALEALELYRKSPFDIVLTDISMPEINGLEMVAKMQKIWPKTEVLFLTGFQDFEYAREAMRLHGFDYLLKPMPDEELLSKISDVIDVLDHKQAENFMFDSMSATLSRQKTNEVSLILLEQMNRGTTDFQQLNNSVFPTVLLNTFVKYPGVSNPTIREISPIRISPSANNLLAVSIRTWTIYCDKDCPIV